MYVYFLHTNVYIIMSLNNDLSWSCFELFWCDQSKQLHGPLVDKQHIRASLRARNPFYCMDILLEVLCDIHHAVHWDWNCVRLIQQDGRTLVPLGRTAQWSGGSEGLQLESRVPVVTWLRSEPPIHPSVPLWPLTFHIQMNQDTTQTRTRTRSKGIWGQ